MVALEHTGRKDRKGHYGKRNILKNNNLKLNYFRIIFRLSFKTNHLPLIVPGTT